MQFSLLTPAHRDEIAPFFEGLLSRTCDLTPGTVLMWRGVNRTEFCIEDSLLFLRSHSSRGEVYYSLPLGKDPAAGIARLVGTQKVPGEALLFSAVPREYLSLFDACGCAYTVRENRDYFDYLYCAEELRELRGKKYSAKRNLIRQFERTYPEHSFVPLNGENRTEVIAFWEEMIAEMGQSSSRVEELERQATSCILAHQAFCGMQGAVLYVGEKIAGFSLGEVIGDTLYTHIEKASRAYKGVYQKLTNLFVWRFAEEGRVSFVNREDDAGDEGLRRAKLDYHPVSLLEKCTVEIRA